MGQGETGSLSVNVGNLKTHLTFILLRLTFLKVLQRATTGQLPMMKPGLTLLIGHETGLANSFGG